ncbi:hypothetical protein K2X33_08985, partial [bacterium]|nr:hypothetical protein [bacterium]
PEERRLGIFMADHVASVRAQGETPETARALFYEKHLNAENKKWAWIRADFDFYGLVGDWLIHNQEFPSKQAEKDSEAARLAELIRRHTKEKTIEGLSEEARRTWPVKYELDAVGCLNDWIRLHQRWPERNAGTWIEHALAMWIQTKGKPKVVAEGRRRHSRREAVFHKYLTQENQRLPEILLDVDAIELANRWIVREGRRPLAKKGSDPHTLEYRLARKLETMGPRAEIDLYFSDDAREIINPPQAQPEPPCDGELRKMELPKFKTPWDKD